MQAAIEVLAGHSAILLAGATLLLALGSAGALWMRCPIHRQRIGELTVLGALVWLVLACIPMRRWSLEDVGNWLGPQRSQAQHGEAREPAADEGRLGAAADPAPVPSSDAEALLVAASLIEAFDALEAGRPGEAETQAVAVAGAGPARPIATPVVEPAGARAAATPWAHDAATGYLAGGAVWTAWLLLGRVLLFRVIRTGGAPPEWLERMYQAVAPGGRRRPRLVVSRRCRQAFSFGILRPTVVLPADACTQECSQALRHVLLHELGHAAQRDAWGNFVLNVALPVLYVHPLYWWLRRQVRVARELIADDWAARRSTKEAYAEDLLALVKARGRVGLSYLGVLGMSAPTSHFYRRMEMLLRREEPLATRCSGAWRWVLLPGCAVVVAALVMAVGAQRTTGQEVESEADVEQAEQAERDADARATESAQEKQLGEEIARLRKQRNVLRAQLEELRAQLEELKVKTDVREQQAKALLEAAREEAVREADLAKRRAAIAATRRGAAREGVADESKGPRSKWELEFYRALAGQEDLSEEQLGAIASGLRKAPVSEEAKANLLNQVYRALVEAQRVRAVRAQRETRVRAQRLAGALAKQEAAAQAQKLAEEDAREKKVGSALAEDVAPYQRSFEAQTRIGAALGRGRSGPQSDLDALVNLATQYVNAQSEIPGAEARLRKMKATNERVPNTFSETDVDAVAIELETAQRKLGLFRAIAEALYEATQVELAAVTAAMEERELSGAERLSAQSQLAQAEAKRKILQLILQ